MNPILLAILAYVALQLAIGFVLARRIRTEDDYLVAGRRMGPLLATGTIFATWFGAETCLAGAGGAYEHGVSLGTAEPFAYGLCVVFLGLVFAARLWDLRLTTLADFFRARFSPGVADVAALLMIPTSLLWAAAQIRAFGQVLATAGALELDLALVLATSIVIVYTAAGGLLADAVTDLVQGACLLVGLGVILTGVVAASGGWSATLAGIAPERVQLLPPETSALALLETWSVPVLGSVVAQELVIRISASRSRSVARGAALAGGGAYLVVGAVPVFLGLAGVALLPGLATGEAILPELARRFLSPLGFALFAGALVSAILSTVDSTLLVCSSLLAHNLVLPRLRAPSERVKLRLARLGVLAFGLLAFVLALSAASVGTLVEEASSFGSAGLFVILVLGLFTRVGGAPSALAALLGGLTAYLAFRTSEFPFLTSLLAAFVGYGCFARLSPPGKERFAGTPSVARDG